MFDDDNTAPTTKTKKQRDEIDLYLECNQNCDNDEDIVNWWIHYGTPYPSLRKLALSLFAIPASSATSERIFSTAGITLSDRRQALSPDSVDSLLLLHSMK